MLSGSGDDQAYKEQLIKSLFFDDSSWPRCAHPLVSKARQTTWAGPWLSPLPPPAILAGLLPAGRWAQVSRESV